MYYEAGERIRFLREQKNYTRERFAEEAGISTKFLYEIEVGHKGFSAKTLYKIAETLKVDTDYILKGNKENNNYSKTTSLLKQFNEQQIVSLDNILELIYRMIN